MALPRGTDVEYLGENASGGMTFGASTSEAISFFGAATTTQPTTSLQAAPSATLTVSGAVTSYGFTTSTQADAVVNCVRSLQAALVSLGLIKGS